MMPAQNRKGTNLAFWGDSIDLCINNVIIGMLCSPSEQLCPDPKEVPIYWKTGAGEHWPYWIPVVHSTKWDGVWDVAPVR